MANKTASVHVRACACVCVRARKISSETPHVCCHSSDLAAAAVFSAASCACALVSPNNCAGSETAFSYLFSARFSRNLSPKIRRTRFIYCCGGWSKVVCCFCENNALKTSFNYSQLQHSYNSCSRLFTLLQTGEQQTEN